jgi:hypothetical protein
VIGPADKPTADEARALLLLAHLDVVRSHRTGERCPECDGEPCAMLAMSDRIVRLILRRKPSTYLAARALAAR